jgi:hypothetical protein
MYPIYPPCITTDKRCSKGVSKIAVNEATVLYWPISTTNGDASGKPRATRTPPATIRGVPNTAAFRGATLVSPTGYIIFKSVQVYNSYAKGEPHNELSMCGPNISPHVTLSVLPKDLSLIQYYLSKEIKSTNSHTFDSMTSTTLPFNLADLNAEQRSWTAYPGAFSDKNGPAWGAQSCNHLGRHARTSSPSKVCWNYVTGVFASTG